ncbi:MAG: bifunctional 3-demethylubiquinol 3-O-methyltransferase/2-polyprenyl-6-hydroxyphenol methylase [Alphaproteobacteria bacterium CG11_big_fil_rev_8_21_14_0_20_39_49]|nr:MAG: bifunctional 3-demethylubiquinol 3-O-methyltransferase/2-polyprenyl-6-hydroxyphenol methylase [Alphaproteobacteria bacterium CG11_big_fil_rev_8_21_14_0_20_39_49]
MTKSKSIDENEIAKFSAMADEWWDLNGKFKPLHKFNPVRIEYIRDNVLSHFDKEGFKGLKFLDIGCGGGLLSEPMARLGADVTSIDASEKNIKIASLHAEQSGLKIDYQCTSAEELAKKGGKFDVVLNMEVIEHVANIGSFVQASADLLKPEGLMFIATLNRTLKSYALAIVGAEYILRWLPKGTHDWKKFLKPSEVEELASENGLKLKEIQGVSYNPLIDKWKLSDDVDVNYMMLFGKQ